jgi:hypothetical protein
MGRRRGLDMQPAAGAHVKIFWCELLPELEA